MPLRKFLERYGSETDQIKLLSELVDNLPVAVFCKDVNDAMRVIIWNKNSERMFGIPQYSILGKNIYEILPREVAERQTQQDFQVVQDNRTIFEGDRTHVNLLTGETIDYRMWKTPVQTVHGKLILCIAQDISEVKRAENEIREQGRRLMSIAGNIPGILYQFKVDTSGKLSFPYCSAKASEVLGLSAETIVENPDSVLSLIHEDDIEEYHKSNLISFKQMKPWKWEGRLRTHGNKIRWFRGTSTPVRQSDGSVIYDGLFLDITTQKEAEEMLRIQEAQLASTSKLVALGEMAGSVAHEINTPLNAIIFCAEEIQTSIEKNTFDKRELHEMSGLISQTAERISKIVKSLKMFARDGSGDPFEKLDLSSVIEQAMSLCSQRIQSNGVRLDFLKPATKIVVSGRAIQLGQVILNLLGNAFDAVAGTKWGWIKIEVSTETDFAFVSITDSGEGLPADVRTKIFQPFFTTKAVGQGTGIGLSLSKEIMEAHEGEIFFDENSPNTRFVLKIPLKNLNQIAS